MPIEHWMMFGTFAEQRHFIYPRTDSYRGAIINGHMAAYAPAGLAAFLLEKTANLAYIIDPITHAFQQDPYFVTDNDAKLRASFARLAEHYGEPVLSVAGVRPLMPHDFSDEEAFREFVKRCLQFQSETLAEAMAQSESMKYLPDDGAQMAPFALIAPYFYMTEATFAEWLPLSVKAVELARTEYPDVNLFASVAVSQGVILRRDIRDQIAEALGSEDVNGYLLWVDNLDEQQAGSAELKGLLELARALRADGTRQVINLHGGYFSILAAGVLGNQALTGVTHGPEFGEYRSVIPVGGGIPIARYYIPHLHTRIRYRDAVRFLGKKGWLKDATTFHDNVCPCEECVATLQGNVANFVKFGEGNIREVARGKGIVRIEYPTGETKLRCLRHYLQRKSLEYQFAATASKAQIIDDLHRGRDEFKDVVGLDGVGHLTLWEETLTGEPISE